MYQDILTIAGVARSGTSWLGEIINSAPEVAYRYQPLFSYAFKDRLTINSTREEMEAFLRELYQIKDDFLLQSEKRAAGIYPTFSKDAVPRVLAMKKARYHYLHIRFLSFFENLKILAIVRNPCAVLASWMANPKEFPPGSDPWLEWRLGNCKNQGRPENFFGFYKWRETTHMFLDLQSQFPQRVKVVQYEDLVADTERVTQAMFEFAGLKYGQQTAGFLEQCHSHSDNPYAVFKAREVKDGWRKKLDPRIVHDVEQELKGTRLEVFLA